MRTLACLALLALLAACVPAGDEAGEPEAPDGREEAFTSDGEAVAAVRAAAAATLAAGSARVRVRLGGAEAGGALELAGVDDFAQDRRRLVPEGSAGTLLVEGEQILVRHPDLGEDVWISFRLPELAEDATATERDVLMLPFTDSAGVLRTLAEHEDLAARPVEEGEGTYLASVPLPGELGVVEDDAWWLQRHAQAGLDRVEVEVEVSGEPGTMRRLAYTLPTPGTRSVRQGEAVGSSDTEREPEAGDPQPGVGMALEIVYAPLDGAEPVASPAAEQVRDVPAEEAAEWLPWAPQAGELRGDED